jgi:DNA-binding CsgD family transcriptional regulator
MRHQDLLDIGQANDLRSFESGLVRLAGELDFPLVSAVLIFEQPGHDPLAISVGNTPKDYLASFNSAPDAQRDPVLQQLKKLGRPVIYDQSTYVRKQAADLWEHQARYGYRTGVAVALHLPNHRHFVMGVDRRDALPADDREVTRLMADLQLVAVHAQDAAVRLLTRDQPQFDEHLQLTPRELEVLKLTMDGLTAAGISDRLAISTPTVNFHLRNLREKLGASSKHQAVLRALSLGLL